MGAVADNICTPIRHAYVITSHTGAKVTKHAYSQAMVVPVKSDLSMDRKLIDIVKNKSLIVHHIIIFFYF